VRDTERGSVSSNCNSNGFNHGVLIPQPGKRFSLP
jgi:hypothetical protein